MKCDYFAAEHSICATQNFKDTFDHKTLIDKNDPHIEWFETGQDLGLLELEK